MNSTVSTSDYHTKKINSQIDEIKKKLASTYENLLTTQQDNELLSLYKNYFSNINQQQVEQINMLNNIIKYLEQIKDSQNLSFEQKNNILNDYPNYFNIHVFANFFNKLSNTMLFTSSNNIVIWSFLLEHEPHCSYIVLCVTPVPLGIQIANFEDWLVVV